jgi:hypothetical protein
MGERLAGCTPDVNNPVSAFATPVFDSGENLERNTKKLIPTTNASNGGSVKPERQPWPSAVSLRRLADE